MIDKIICLHCDKRKDDIDELKRSAEYNGFDIEWYITGDGTVYDHYDGIDDDLTNLEIMRNGSIVKEGTYPGQRSWPVTPDRQRVINVATHHKKILQNVLDQGLENVLLLEDDVVFTNDAREIWEKVEKPVDWNVLLLGGFVKSPFKVLQEYPNEYFEENRPEFIKIDASAGFYGVLLNRQSIKWILDFVQSEKQIDVTNPNISRYKIKHGPVDWSLNYIDKQYVLMPPIIIEKPNLSLINDNHKKRNLYVQADLDGRILRPEKDKIIPSPKLKSKTGYKWAIGITTAPRPKHYTLKRCVESVQENGWTPTVFAEPNSKLDRVNCDIIQRTYRHGVWYNWLGMVEELLENNPHADAILTIQDDTLLHPQARWVADHHFSLSIGMFSLYTSVYYGRWADVYKNGSLRHKKVEYEWAIRTFKEGFDIRNYYKKPGIHKVDYISLWGACALVFSRKLAERILNSKIINSWTGIPRQMSESQWLNTIKDEPWRIKNSDTVIGEFLHSENIKFYVPVPSLAEHIARHSSDGVNHGGRHNGRSASEFYYEDLRKVFDV